MKKKLSLVTIVTEGILKEQFTELLLENGASGFTITRAEGQGSKGVRARDFEGPNLRFEAIVSPAAADQILDTVEKKYFENYSVIAWVSNVEVLRGDKFVTEENA
ncbi:hypothetical protein N9Z02_00725 [Akkermansiaceae bacterium]|nr:hypothetical protein [Akkermansiaceae bacterium]